ncbi:winged-helix domain-containing protein [Mesorhizobium sp. IMUNJ 23232]|uniref:winged-helix domain-containing protein n=1 Tax=Mesorhizobium sp. IMUNJ 23232 TaxID=3376064 RepID=UPI00378991BC
MTMVVGICSEDPELYLVLAHILQGEGYESRLIADIREIQEAAEEASIEVIILDCRPENKLAAAYISFKRERSFSIPTIAFIKPGAEHQYFELLRSGIEACLVRPLVPAQFLDLLRGTVKNGKAKGASESGERICYQDLEMHLKDLRVFRSGEEVYLKPISFNLLRHLLENPNKVVSRTELIRAAWPSNVYVGDRTVDVHMSQLRKSLKSSNAAELIRTVRLGGYALRMGDNAPTK